MDGLALRRHDDGNSPPQSTPTTPAPIRGATLFETALARTVAWSLVEAVLADDFPKAKALAEVMRTASEAL